jgi:hypothetical protein
VKTFFSGSGPLVNRAMLVGAVQVRHCSVLKYTVLM